VNGYNGISVALKAASAGTAPAAGIRIMRMMTMTSNQPSVPPAAKDWVLQLPSQGNLLVFTTNQNSVIDLAAAGAVTDNAAAACGGSNNTWVRKTLGTDTPQIWHATGPANTCNSLKVTLHIPTTSSGSPCTVNMYDITGAAASAYDTGTTCNAAQGTDNGACGSACAGSCGQPNVTALNHQTDITPGTASGLVFAALVIGTGPMGVTTAPAGAIDDFVHYNGETDRDLICNADGMQHLYNTSSAAENWTWTLWSTWAVLGQASQSIHFLAPAAAAGGPPQRTLTNAGL